MKSASVREVRNDFGRILAWVASGEEVAITNRRQPVARLLPVRQKRVIRKKMPDVTARLRKVFGEKTIPDQAMKELLSESRGRGESLRGH